MQMNLVITNWFILYFLLSSLDCSSSGSFYNWTWLAEVTALDCELKRHIHSHTHTHRPTVVTLTVGKKATRRICIIIKPAITYVEYFFWIELAIWILHRAPEVWTRLEQHFDSSCTQVVVFQHKLNDTGHLFVGDDPLWRQQEMRQIRNIITSWLMIFFSLDRYLWCMHRDVTHIPGKNCPFNSQPLMTLTRDPRSQELTK